MSSGSVGTGTGSDMSRPRDGKDQEESTGSPTERAPDALGVTWLAIGFVALTAVILASVYMMG